MSSKNDIVRLALIGLVSGSVSYLSFFSTQYFDDDISSILGIFVLPGAIFGLAIALYCYYTRKVRSVKKLTLFVLASTMMHAFACLLTALTLGLLLVPLGIIGALFLLIVTNYLFFPVSGKQLLVLTLYGGVSTLSYLIYPLIAPADHYALSIYKEGVMLIFLFWQTGLAAGIGWISSKSKIRPKPL